MYAVTDVAKAARMYENVFENVAVRFIHRRVCWFIQGGRGRTVKKD
jgi:glycerol-3-phosphate O-acyltransferase